MTAATQVLAYLYIYPMCVDLPEEEEQQPPAEPPPVVEKVPDDHDNDYCDWIWRWLRLNAKITKTMVMMTLLSSEDRPLNQ